MNDITAIYYTSDTAPTSFLHTVREYLSKAIDNIPLIEIHQPKTTPRSHLQIYKNALQGARMAKTKYIAFCEDDVLYTKEHFKNRPQEGKFAYNMSVWSIYTWIDPPMFSWKDRRNLSQLICERELFIEAMDERFDKYIPEVQEKLGNEWFVKYWAEPGKYERQIGVTKRETEEFFTEPPNIAFSHETALSFSGLGKKKKLGHLRSYEVPFWGKARDILNYYV